jgi:hypothetical protein
MYTVIRGDLPGESAMVAGIGLAMTTFASIEADSLIWIDLLAVIELERKAGIVATFENRIHEIQRLLSLRNNRSPAQVRKFIDAWEGIRRELWIRNIVAHSPLMQGSNAQTPSVDGIIDARAPHRGGQMFILSAADLLESVRVLNGWAWQLLPGVNQLVQWESEERQREVKAREPKEIVEDN